MPWRGVLLGDFDRRLSDWVSRGSRGNQPMRASPTLNHRLGRIDERAILEDAIANDVESERAAGSQCVECLDRNIERGPGILLDPEELKRNGTPEEKVKCIACSAKFRCGIEAVGQR